MQVAGPEEQERCCGQWGSFPCSLVASCLDQADSFCYPPWASRPTLSFGQPLLRKWGSLCTHTGKGSSAAETPSDPLLCSLSPDCLPSVLLCRFKSERRGWEPSLRGQPEYAGSWVHAAYWPFPCDVLEGTHSCVTCACSSSTVPLKSSNPSILNSGKANLETISPHCPLLPPVIRPCHFCHQVWGLLVLFSPALFPSAVPPPPLPSAVPPCPFTSAGQRGSDQGAPSSFSSTLPVMRI